MNKLIVKNTFFLYILTFSNYFLGLLIYPYLSRILSVENFGLIGFSNTYVLSFQVIIEFGFMISTTAQIAKYRYNLNKVSKIVWNAIYAKGLLTIISLLFFLCSIYFVSILRENFLIIFLFFINAVLSAFMPDFFFRGVEKMGIITIRTVVIKLASLAMIFLIVKNSSQILFVPIAMILGNIIALTMSFVYMKKLGVKIIKFSLLGTVSSIKGALAFFFSRLAVSINSSLGAFFLGINFSPASLEIGIFSGASRISSSAEMMLPPVVDSIYPHMINKKDYHLLKRILILGTAILFVICSVVVIFSGQICEIILGPQYLIAGDYLRILMIGVFFAYPNMILGYPALSPIGQDKHANASLLVSVLLNLVICGILWLLNAITPLAICFVIGCRNVVILIYRCIVIYKYRSRIVELSNVPRNKI